MLAAYMFENHFRLVIPSAQTALHSLALLQPKRRGFQKIVRLIFAWLASVIENVWA